MVWGELWRWVFSVLIVSCVSLGAIGIEGEEPQFKMLRWEENWANVDSNDSFLGGDQLKNVSLSKGRMTGDFGGSLRGRVEHWGNFAWGGVSNDNDEFYLHRLQFHSDIHVGKRARLFLEFINASSTDRNLPGIRRLIDVDEADLLNGFIDINGEISDVNLTARVGRQQFAFGKQRLVSALPWANTWNKWDGASAILSYEDFLLHSFYGSLVEVEPFDFNRSTNDDELFGFYSSIGMNYDFYYVGHRRDDAKGNEERHTLGLRHSGNIAGTHLDYDGEFAYQFGDEGGLDVSSFMVATELGYESKSLWGEPRFWIGADIASGDSERGDGDQNTFDQLFPLGHAFLGYIDIVGRQNIVAANYGISLSPGSRWKVRVANHLFWRAESEDDLYSPSGQIVRSAGAGARKRVGSEMDLLVNYRVNRNLTATIGYSRFFAGDFIDNTGASEDIDFLYSSFELKF